MIHCKNCGYSFFGRTNQDFCCDKCRYQYNNKRVKVERSGINEVLKILIRNREILKALFESGPIKISKDDLISKKYNFTYLTHQLRSPEGQNFIFCFEYGFSVSKDYLKLTKYDGTFSPVDTIEQISNSFAPARKANSTRWIGLLIVVMVLTIIISLYFAQPSKSQQLKSRNQESK